MLSLLKRLALPAALLLALPAAAHDGVHLADPYARILMGNGVVYFRIDNHADQPDRLMAARTDLGMAMLMTTAEDANGMMQMRDMPEGFAIDAAGSHLLRPAGDHVMLMNLHHEPADGETFTLTLTFERAGEVTLTVPVDNTRRSEPGMEPTPFDASSDGTPAASAEEAVIQALTLGLATSDATVTAGPVLVLGDHALAAWSQGDRAGRALLQRGPHGWALVLLAGEDLRRAAFLAEHGVPDAEALSQGFNAAEDALGSEAVQRFSGFQGVEMMAEHVHE